MAEDNARFRNRLNHRRTKGPIRDNRHENKLEICIKDDLLALSIQKNILAFVLIFEDSIPGYSVLDNLYVFYLFHF